MKFRFKWFLPTVGTLPPNTVFFIVLPMLCIAVNSPNLAHQHWEGKKTVKCPNNFDWDCRLILDSFVFYAVNLREKR